MIICKKCGFEFEDSFEYCPMCACAVAEEAGFAGGTASEPQMTPEESVALAEKLASDYEALRLIKDEIEDCELEINRNQTLEVRPRYSAFRFFWPFLIIAAIAFWVVFLVGTGIAVVQVNRDGVYVAEFIGFAVAAIILAAGGVRARRKREELNDQYSEIERSRNQASQVQKRRLDELKVKQRKMQREADKYNDQVPVTMRNKSQMERVKASILTGRAQTFSEAVELCHTTSF